MFWDVVAKLAQLSGRVVADGKELCGLARKLWVGHRGEGRAFYSPLGGRGNQRCSVRSMESSGEGKAMDGEGGIGRCDN